MTRLRSLAVLSALALAVGIFVLLGLPNSEDGSDSQSLDSVATAPFSIDDEVDRFLRRASDLQPPCWETIDLPPARRAWGTIYPRDPGSQISHAVPPVNSLPAVPPVYSLEDLIATELLDHPFREGTFRTDLIIVGEVVGTAPYNRTSVRHTIEVEESLKGEMKPGDTLRVTERPGAYAHRAEGVDYALGPLTEPQGVLGIPPMRTGERYLLFLKSIDGATRDNMRAYVVGSFQGKMRINHGRALEFPGPMERLPREVQSPAIPPTSVWAPGLPFRINALLHGCPFDEVTADIRDILAAGD